MKRKNPLACSHEPLDYAHFERIAQNIRPWGEISPDMMLGECRACYSSISYPKGPSFKPSCYEPKPGLDLDIKAELISLAEAQIRYWNDIPPGLQDLITGYIDRREYPGPILSAIIGCNEPAQAHISELALANEDYLAILNWLNVAACEAWSGSPEIVRNWIAGKPKAMTEAEVFATNMIDTQDGAA